MRSACPCSIVARGASCRHLAPEFLLKRANAIFDELRQGLEEIEFLSDPTAGELRIGTTEPMAAILSTAIERLSLRHPLMVFHVTVGDTRILLRDLRDRNLDLAITRMDGTAMERDIELETLFHVDWPLSPDRQTR